MRLIPSWPTPTSTPPIIRSATGTHQGIRTCLALAIALGVVLWVAEKRSEAGSNAIHERAAATEAVFSGGPVSGRTGGSWSAGIQTSNAHAYRVTTTPATDPIVTLDPGDVYRITFTVNPAARTPGFVPDGGLMVLNIRHDCSGRVLTSVSDGHRLLGYMDTAALPLYGGPPSCQVSPIFGLQSAPFGWVIDDVEPLVSGSIVGHVDITAVTQTQFAELTAPGQAWQILPCDRNFMCSVAGVSIVSRTVIKAPSIPRPVAPVVFVHGACANNGTWPLLNATLAGGGWRFGGAVTDPVTLAGLVNDQAADYYLVEFTDRAIQIGLEVWAAELSLYLRRISAFRTGSSSQQFITVAHGAGGLAARQYLESADYLGNIRHLITYGTPHLGIPNATLFQSAALNTICHDPALVSLFKAGTGIQQMSQGSSFLQTLNAQAFPQGPLHTSLIGNNKLCRVLLPGDHDCAVPVDSQNIANVSSPPKAVETSTTTRSHATELSDMATMLWAINREGALQGVDRVLIQASSSIDILVTDPIGRTISRTDSAIPLAAYDEIVDQHGTRHSTVTIPVARAGDYRIAATPRAGASAADPFSITVTRNSAATSVARGVPLGAIPSGGYGFTVGAPHRLDLNGDQLGDAFLYNVTTGAWAFQATNQATAGFATISGSWDPGWQVYPALLNSDQFDDFFLYDPARGLWVQALNHAGDGTFTYTLGNWDRSWAVRPADLDGDGLTDIFVYNVGTGQWVKCLVDGSGGFKGYADGRWDAGLTFTTADLNGDGRDDFFLYSRPTGVWIEALSQAGVGTFDYPAEGQWDPGWRIAPARLNDDGRTDLLVYNAAGMHVSALSRAAGGFDYVGGPLWPQGWSVTPGDLNNDGETDLFLYNPINGSWTEAFSDGAGGFTYAAGQWDSGWQVAVTHLNTDGRGDVLVGRADGTWVRAVNTNGGTFSYSTGNWGTGWTILAAR